MIRVTGLRIDNPITECIERRPDSQEERVTIDNIPIGNNTFTIELFNQGGCIGDVIDRTIVQHEVKANELTHLRVTLSGEMVFTIEVDPSSVSLPIGRKQQFTVTLRNADNEVLLGKEVIWSSSDPDIVDIDANGLAEAIAEGSVTITATSEGKSGTANLVVSRSVENAYLHLNEVMDKFHESFDLYTDQDAGGNHFYPSGWMGDTSSILFDSNWNSDCYSGTSCIKITFTSGENNWAGIYWQEPENNGGTIPNGGYNITGATKLTFKARGEKGGERVEFFVGGITGPYPDSSKKTSTGYITLTTSWQEYSIDLTSKDLSHVIGGFGWVTNSPNNPSGAIFYLDDIKYDKVRSDELRFPVSYETLSSIDPDRYIRNASFIYDIDIAMIAYMARGEEDEMRRAKILADTLLYAMENDRFYTDCRLRNAYMSGNIADHLTGKTRLPGWWDPDEERWFEDRYQVSSYTGNIAWTIIALTEYYRLKGGEEYKDAALCLGDWIYDNTYDTRGEGGYTGGYDGWEPDPTKILWKSTEHNIDVYVAFMRLYELTDNTAWRDRAIHAKRLVNSMWDEAEGHFWTGTLDDGVTVNKSNIPVDIQAWGIMALGNLNRYRRLIDWVEDNAYVEVDGFKCFDFNNDKDGCWFEGTAHVALAYQIIGDTTKSNTYLGELRNAQVNATNNNGKGIVAASHDRVTTGFDWLYFTRLHIGATAWYILAEEGYNPYWGIATTDPVPYQNQGPIAEAGDDQTVNEGDDVILDGSKSSDPDGDTLTYTWVQIEGPIVTLNNPDTVNPSFTAPSVTVDTSLTFELTVSDGEQSDTDTIVIEVKNEVTESILTYADFSEKNEVCTPEDNWCGWAGPDKTVIYGYMKTTFSLPQDNFDRLDVTIFIPCNGWGEGLHGPNGSSAEIIVDTEIKNEPIDDSMPYHHGGYYRYEWCENFTNSFSISGKNEITLTIKMDGGAILDFEKATLRYY